jgi:hypothetical protein
MQVLLVHISILHSPLDLVQELWRWHIDDKLLIQWVQSREQDESSGLQMLTLFMDIKQGIDGKAT